MRARYDVRETTVDGCPVLRLTPRQGASGQHLIYTHGGWYVHALVAKHWWFIDRSTRGTGVTITLPFYRLAPEGGVERAYELLRTVYAELTASGSGAQITLAGDSAGGGLALGQAIAYRDAGAPAPRQVILFSPGWTSPWPTRRSRPCSARDPMLHAAEPVAFGPPLGRRSRSAALPASARCTPTCPACRRCTPSRAVGTSSRPTPSCWPSRLRQAGNPGTLHLRARRLPQLPRRLLDPGGPGRSSAPCGSCSARRPDRTQHRSAEGKWSAGSNQGSYRR